MPGSLPPEDEIARLRAEKDQGASLRDRAGQQSPSPAVSAASAVTITSRGPTRAHERMVMAAYDYWRHNKRPPWTAGPKAEVEWVEGIINAALEAQ
ncbi:MAG: hypothetical protein INR70_05225 [Parafilimonas terrae]|nr:hypothetical protein [Parafilimonas terrae]